ncbi:serine/threonine protein kinase [Planctomicrobium sp. SH527]|uniref:serine/threonine protein kinase n=1 Tax=Planctomicrobium sp. SH527 TaxID=3448123 RepID=UPI003F5CAF7F
MKIPEKTLAHISSEQGGSTSDQAHSEGKGAFETVVSNPDGTNLVGALVREMQARWAEGDRSLCEEYLNKLPETPKDSNSAVDLIYNEYLLRKQYGLNASFEMFASRFPEYSDAIQRQLQLEDMVLQTQAPLDALNSPWSSNHQLIGDQKFPVTVGRYLLLSPLGTGGQAHVYLGMHPVLHRQVVVKISKVRLNQHFSVADSLLHEGRILASLDHPNLVRVHDVDVVDSFPIIVMDYVRGESLEDYTRFKKLTDREMRSLIRSIANAVDYIHHQGLLHLDIKPKNIIIDEHGMPRLIDFGIAQLDNAWVSSGPHQEISGTLQYMAPEQVPNGEIKLGRHTDIYALGGVLYFLLTGLAPIRAETFHKLVEKVRVGGWDRDVLEKQKSNLQLARLCTRAMALEPQDRFASAGEFATALKFSGRSRRAVAVGCLLLCGLVTYTGWKYAGSNRVEQFPAASLAAIPETATSSEPELVVSVWNKDHFEPIQDRVPLVSGDGVNFRMLLPPGMEGALLHFDVDHGGLTLGKWNAADQVRTLSVPDRGSVLPLEGARSVQVLLFCVAESVGPVVEEIEAVNAIPRGVELPEYSILLMDGAGIRLEDQGRGFGLPISISRTSGEQSVKELMRQFQLIAERHHGKVTGMAFLKK